jgi:RNA 2',3'-cyclic 3'-phosphodiesterase
MPEQLLLPGIEVPARPTDRLFFALQPDAETAQRVAALAQTLREQQGLKGKPLKTQHFHVTLHFLGDHLELPEAVVRAACEAAACVAQPPFQMVFDRVASFHNKRRLQPLVLRCGDEPSPVMALRQTLADALKQVGLARLVDTRFTPHLTLLYDARLVPSQAIEPIAWTASEFVLIHSLIGKTRHIPLGRWPLRG